MNENKTSCAPTDNRLTLWDSIDWTKAELAVRKLQARIVKAQKEGRTGKVKALQWTLTHSFLRKSLSRKESYFQRRWQHPRGGHGNMGETRSKNTSDKRTQTQRLSAEAIEKSPHQKEQWQTASVGNTDNERQSHASTLPYGIGTSSRDYWRYSFIWIPQGTPLYGCCSAMS